VGCSAATATRHDGHRIPESLGSNTPRGHRSARSTELRRALSVEAAPGVPIGRHFILGRVSGQDGIAAAKSPIDQIEEDFASND
jgi:hypothetical protein